MIPTVRDLRFVWEEMPQQMLDEQQQKVRDSLRAALINWARAAGEGSDYTDNLPAPMPAPGRPLVRSAEPAAQRRAGPAAGRAPAAEVPDAPQHRHARRRCRPGPVRPASGAGRLPHLRGHHPPPRRSRRRPGARQRPGPPGRGAGHAARGGRVRPELLQLEHLLD